MSYVRALLTIIMAMLLSDMEAQTAISLDEVRKAGLRVVDITTLNGEEPKGQQIANPWDDSSMYNFTYTNKVPCRIVITMGNDTLYDSGEYKRNVGGAIIRINGNTSAYYSNELNMPYKLKLEKSSDLLCRHDDERYADKHWRLLKDAITLNTIVGLRMSELLGLEWTAGYVPCNVIINGDYRGCYLLMETVRRNNNCRISTDEQTGYIVERDPYWWKEDTYFSTPWYENSNTYRWTWKYPDAEDVTSEQEEYIRQFITEAEEAIREGQYENYIDVVSFAKWLLAHDLLGTYDSGGSNIYMKKYDNTNSSLLEMPCLWDFDSSFRMTKGNFSRLHTSSNAYFSTMFNSSDDTFARTYISLWNENKARLKQLIISFINDYINSDEGKALDNSRKLYNKRWGYNYSSVTAYVQRDLQWFNSHFDLLDKQIQNINSSIHDTFVERKAQKHYDLRGIQLYRQPNTGIHKETSNDNTLWIIHSQNR